MSISSRVDPLFLEFQLAVAIKLLPPARARAEGRLRSHACAA